MFVRVIFGARRDVAHKSGAGQYHAGVLVLHARGENLAVGEELVKGAVGEVLLLRTYAAENRSDGHLRDVE